MPDAEDIAAMILKAQEPEVIKELARKLGADATRFEMIGRKLARGLAWHERRIRLTTDQMGDASNALDEAIALGWLKEAPHASSR